MAYEEENIVQEWLDYLKDLNVETKKMFGCYCLYCDGQAVGWIHDSVLSLREVGLDYLPKDIKRPSKEDKIQELVIPLDYANADWLPKAVQDTADRRRRQRENPFDEVTAMKQITNKEYEEWQKYKAEKAKGHILLPDTVRFICEANGYDAEKIGQHFLEILPKIRLTEQR